MCVYALTFIDPVTTLLHTWVQPCHLCVRLGERQLHIKLNCLQQITNPGVSASVLFQILDHQNGEACVSMARLANAPAY